MVDITRQDEVRREGGKALQHSVPGEKAIQYSKGQSYTKNAETPQMDGPAACPDAGYVGGVGELERNDDTRHPTSKIWVRRDRKPNAYLHTGNG